MELLKNDILNIMNVLGDAYLVGGCVRDFLLNEPCTDVDMASPLPPHKSMALLKNAGYRVIETGIKHGTITVLLEEGQVELTSFRKDILPTGRHSDVSFNVPMIEDASRRDFTINALYMDGTGKIYDFFDGISDLEKGIVRFIGNAELRIAEDYLRILRFFRFWGRFGRTQPDKEGLRACVLLKEGLTFLSLERKRDELLKILVLKRAQMTLTQMKKAGILDMILQTTPTFKGLDKLPFDPLLRLWFILGDKNVPPLKLSQKQGAFLKNLTAAMALPLQTLHDKKTVAYLYGGDILNAALVLCGKKPSTLTPPIFPITSSDLMRAFHLSGPDIGEALKIAQNEWMNMNFPSKKEVVLKKISDIIKGTTKETST